MFLHINPSSKIPIYLQIIDQIKLCIVSGMLSAEELLPSIRELAVQLTVNPNTVARVYRELEKDGIVETIRGKGVYVSKQKDAFVKTEKKRIISQDLNKALADAFNLDMDVEEVRKILEEEIIRFKKRRP